MKTLDYLHLGEEKVSGVVSALSQLLADFQVHYTNLRGMHWNVKGPSFFELHAKLEEYYDDAEEKIDEIAERILMLGGVPESKFSEYLKVAKISELGVVCCPKATVEYVLNSYKVLIEQERKVLDLASQAGDEVTVSLMSDYLKGQEKTVWMLVAYSAEKK